MPKNLKTGWMCIATSGPTIDGRTIEKSWLTDFAEHYNPKLYSAKIWPDHERYFGAQGKVLALKIEPATEPELEGEIHLMAIIAPSDELVYANQRGKYVHTSIEVIKNFAGKGFFYLGGLAVTDTPASLGTTELAFNETAEKFYFQGAQLDLTDVEEVPEKTSAFRSMFGRNQKPDDEQENAMKDEQFQQMLGALTATQQAVVALGETFRTQNPAPAKDDKPGETTKTVSSEQFAELQTQHAALQEKFNELNEQFKEALATPKPGTTPAGIDNNTAPALY